MKAYMFESLNQSQHIFNTQFTTTETIENRTKFYGVIFRQH